MEYKLKRRLIIGISIILLIILYIFKNYNFMIRVAGVIFGLWAFYFLDHAFGIRFHLRHYIYIIIILIFGIFLSPLYYISESYDKILHLAMPILASIMVFFIVNKMKIKFQWKLLITLTSMLSILAVLEIGEYLFDMFLDFKLQGVYLRDLSGLEKYDLVLNKNDDTMIDMMLGFAGAIIFSISKSVCYFYNKRHSKKIRDY